MLIKSISFLVIIYLAAAVPVLQTPGSGKGLAAEAIADSYIVVFKKGLPDSHLDSHLKWIQDLQNVQHTYNAINFKGYSGKFSPRTLEKIKASDEVAYVERDSIVYASMLEVNATWGLSRLSHRHVNFSSQTYPYTYDGRAGEGVTVYVIDTGIDIENQDFEGRAIWGKTIPKDAEDKDDNGHGTHVSGTIAGYRYGVAKKATLVAVKVLNDQGSGSFSDIIAGVEWVINEHKSTQNKTSVANMSLGGRKNKALNDIVNSAVDNGIVFAVAAGNDATDACDVSPASAENAITVGASDISDELAYFSNIGSCVDIIAPGVDVLSDWNDSKNATKVDSGTSMASPHVAGLAAYLISLALENVTITPKNITDQIITLSTKNALKSVPHGTVNKLVYNGYSDISNIAVKQ